MYFNIAVARVGKRNAFVGCYWALNRDDNPSITIPRVYIPIKGDLIMSNELINLSLKHRSELNKLVAIAEQTIKEMDAYKNEDLEEVKANVER